MVFATATSDFLSYLSAAISEGSITALAALGFLLTFKATGKGTTTVRFGLTKGETAKAFESRRVTVRVR